jgi:16S rRNA G966 N2-methylase RsmD
VAAGEPFDLVFCDPPWDDAERALHLLQRLARAGVFTPGARVLLEHAARDRLEPLNDGPLVFTATRRWGDTAVSALMSAERRPAS